MKLACWFGRHDYSVVGEWRRERPDSGNGAGLRPYGYCSDYDYTYCGGGIKVECLHCGKREYACFVLPSPEDAWKRRLEVNPEWRVAVKGHTRLHEVVNGPTHAEIAAEIGRRA